MPKQENCLPFETVASSPAANGDTKEDEFVDRDDDDVVVSVADLLTQHSFNAPVDPIKAGADCVEVEGP